MQSDRDARIRDRAYQIWDREGRRDGEHEAHWQQAEREIEAEEAMAANPPAGSSRAKNAAVTSEASPPTVSRARAGDDAAATKPRTRAAKPDTPAKAAPARRSKAT